MLRDLAGGGQGAQAAPLAESHGEPGSWRAGRVRLGSLLAATLPSTRGIGRWARMAHPLEAHAADSGRGGGHKGGWHGVQRALIGCWALDFGCKPSHKPPAQLPTPLSSQALPSHAGSAAAAGGAAPACRKPAARPAQGPGARVCGGAERPPLGAAPAGAQGKGLRPEAGIRGRSGAACSPTRPPPLAPPAAPAPRRCCRRPAIERPHPPQAANQLEALRQMSKASGGGARARAASAAPPASAGIPPFDPSPLQLPLLLLPLPRAWRRWWLTRGRSGP